MSDPSVKITIIPNGSARIECERAEIVLANGETVIKEGKFSLCRCGTSKQKPFCDGSHKTCDFEG